MVKVPKTKHKFIKAARLKIKKIYIIYKETMIKNKTDSPSEMMETRIRKVELEFMSSKNIVQECRQKKTLKADE